MQVWEERHQRKQVEKLRGICKRACELQNAKIPLCYFLTAALRVADVYKSLPRDSGEVCDCHVPGLRHPSWHKQINHQGCCNRWRTACSIPLGHEIPPRNTQLSSQPAQVPVLSSLHLALKVFPRKSFFFFFFSVVTCNWKRNDFCREPQDL